MLSVLNVFIACLWLFSAVVDYTEFTYLWQLKEYRWDRFRDFLSTRQGRMYWLRYQLLWRSGIAIIMFFWPLNDVPSVKYALVLLFSADVLYTLYRLFRGWIRRPKPTMKAAIIIVGSLVLEGTLFLLAQDWAILFLLLITRFLLLTFIVFLLNQPTRLLKQYFIRKAQKKIERYPNIRIIGVTGSYAKSSVKKFLFHILSEKYRVLKTPKNINTEIGVAQCILSNNLDNVDIFIVEMGAYRKGEIKYICDMVHPSIGILTAINEQHLSLFGSIQETQAAKYELLRSLPENGLAVTNSDNVYCREFLDELKTTVQTFGYDKEWKPTCQITNIKDTDTSVEFSFTVENSSVQITTPRMGDYHAMNIAPCILVAKYLGMSDAEIKERCVTLPVTTLGTYQYGNCTIIDDSYNSNPEGFKSALAYISTFPSKRRRIVITRGMLELGNKSDELHERIGEEIAFTTDELVLISRDYEEPIRRGIGMKYRTTVIVKENPSDLLDYLREIKETDAVILLENRVGKVIHDELTSKS
ncbi:MAG TPA: UDP-N-acetylmuramoyl-tripeptide--D-alanyl-D-alanine ligase [Candidatus Kapabacteria bacterium]|nr:UDP-N-acetylmuramoyl-tripeptide--D-alanyl-D-alanine ligase [Candidatus Kapabacteria bacterium]